MSFGETGNPPPVTAGFMLDADAGEAYWWLGSLTINKVRGQATHGGIDVVDHRVPPGYAPPRHIHRDQDEIFFVIDGSFQVHCADRTWTAGPGSLVFLPRDVPHGFTVSDDGPGRTLLINAPAGFADLIEDLGEPATQLALPGDDVPVPDPDRAAAISQAHGIYNA